MSRHGYIDDIDDNWELIRWRGRVASAIRGKRGQKLLREMRDALDAMPEKELITGALVDEEGAVCALGCVGKTRQIDMSGLDPEEPEQVAVAFDVAEVLVREIAYENDEYRSFRNEQNERHHRWIWMRRWVERHIKKEEAE